jgi:hypothetical protein
MMRSGTVILRVTLLSLYVVFAASGLAAEDVPASLEDMPWYEAPQDDYHEYTPEEVRKFIPDEAEESPEFQMGERPPGLPPGLQQLVLILFLGLLIFFSVYLAYRWYQERETEIRPLKTRERPAGPEVLDLPGIEEAVATELDLNREIDGLLKEGRLGKATVYIFVFLLRELSAREYIALQRHVTARGYARMVRSGKDIPTSVRDIFAEAAEAFELVAYSERRPERDVARLWERAQAELKSLAMSGGPGGAE